MIPRPSVAAALAALALVSAAGRAPAQDVDLDVESSVLDNGLTVVVHHDPTAVASGMELWFATGFADEPIGSYGLAHLFEHLLRPPASFWTDRVDSLAEPRMLGSNAQTRTDYTRYYVEVPANALDLGMAMLAARMATVEESLNAEALERQRDVVAVELGRGEGRFWHPDLDGMREAGTFGADHPYGHDQRLEDLAAVTVDDLHAWHTRHGAPSNALLLVAGGADPETVLASARRYFGPLPAGGRPPRIARAPVPRPTPRVDVVEIDEAPRTVYRWAAPGYGDPDIEPLALLVDALAGGPGSRLGRALPDSLVVEVDGEVEPRRLASLVEVTVFLREGADPALVDGIVADALRRRLDGGPTAAEVDAARARWRRETIEDLQSLAWIGGRTETLGEGALFAGDPRFYRTRRVAQATSEDLADAGRRWLEPEPYRMRGLSRPPRSTADAPLDLSVPDLPPPPDPLPAGTRRLDFPEGLPAVWWTPRTTLPLVHLSLLVDGGWLAEREGEAGRASLVAEIAAADPRIEVDVDAERTRFDVTALPEEIDRVVAALARVARGSDLAAADPAPARARRLEAIERQRASPAERLDRVIPRLAFGSDHPLGRAAGGLGDPEGIAASDRAALLDFHARSYRPESTTLVVTGAVTEPAVRAALAAFDGWEASGPAGTRDLPDPEPASAGVYVLDRPGAATATVGAIRPIGAGEAPDPASAAAADLALFGRVNAVLRRQRGWAYQVLTGVPHGLGYAFVGAAVPAERAADALLEIEAALGALADPDSAAAALEDALRALLRRRLARADALSDVHERAIAERDGTDAGPVLRAAMETLGLLTGREGWLRIVVGDRAAIVEALRAAGLGEIRAAPEP